MSPNIRRRRKNRGVLWELEGAFAFWLTRLAEHLMH